MTAQFDFYIFKPQKMLADHVQGIWSACTPQTNTSRLKQWLHCDGGSGILFNLGGEIQIGDITFKRGVILLPVTKHAQPVYFPPGSLLVGVRFHPAIGRQFLGDNHQTEHQAIQIATSDDDTLSLSLVYQHLLTIKGKYARTVLLYRWISQLLFDDEVREPFSLPIDLKQALANIKQKSEDSVKPTTLSLSQRQLERHFQKWMNITPKYYQRIIRVNKTLQALKLNPDAELVDLAFQYGFTDQAHMTREFQTIAKITPKQYSKKVKATKSI